MIRSKKIGVLSGKSLGDFILMLPALNALKKAYPEAELVVLGRKIHLDFFEGRQGPVDRIEVVPSCIQFEESASEVTPEKEEFIFRMREEKFDILFQLEGGGKFTNGFIQELKPGLSIGAKTKDAPPLDINVAYTQFQHEILRQLEIVRKAGATTEQVSPVMDITEKDLLLGKTFLSSYKEEFAPFVLFNPGATDPKRRWPPHKFAQIADSLIESGYRIFINVDHGEEAIGRKVHEAMKEKANAFVIRPGPKELTGIVALSELVISNDAGTFHLALALQKPTVSLFWPGNLLNYGPMVGAHNRVLISRQSQCPVCDVNYFEQNCSHDYSIVSDISPQSVIEASVDLLSLKMEKGVSCGENQS